MFGPLISVLAVILGLVLVGPISPASALGNPAGNNGTIKVDDDGLPDCGNGDSNDNCSNGVGNDPHLHCQFYIEWYNFDANTTSQVSFEMQDNPQNSLHLTSTGPLTVQLDGDDASGANAAGLDGKELYSLHFDGPAPQPQGFHVKVTVHTDGSQGNDTKSKVYWVDGCQDASAAVTTTPSDCDSPEHLVLGDIVNATWGTPSRTDGPGAYSVTATATDGHAFPGGGATKTITGTLAGDQSHTQGCNEQPQPTTRTVPHSEDNCDIGGFHTWDVLFTTTYTWDEEQQKYVGHEDNGVVQNDTTTPYTHDQAVEHGCSQAPEPTTRTEHHSVDNCDIGGFHTWDVLFTTTYTWDEEQQKYVGHEDNGVIQNDTTTPYTHDQAVEHECTQVPEPTTRTEHHLADGCAVGGVHTWDVVFTTTYAWDEEKGEYVGTEDAGVIKNDVFTVYTHDQQVELGCTTLPEPLERVVHQSEESCDLGGVHSWDDVYTTTFTWDGATGTYVGTETGPVAENDLLTPYTAKQAQALGCIEVEGEQTHGHHQGHHNTPEVKGEQAHAPAAAVVPTQVEAGLAGTPAGIPAGGGSNNLPLWALSMGAGMFLIGAGRLRRTSRATR